jgi:hypothetical protein
LNVSDSVLVIGCRHAAAWFTVSMLGISVNGLVFRV